MSGIYSELTRYASELGFRFYRNGARHEIWQHETTGRRMAIPRGGRRQGRTLLNIKANLRQAAEENV